jgi:hypothetical protein
LTNLLASCKNINKISGNPFGEERIMEKRKKINKIYRTNKDTISLNVEQFSTDLGLFPYAEKWEGEESHWWLPPSDPRKLRKKGSQVCK